MKQINFAICLLLFLISMPLKAAQINQLVIFGDSLSDVKNLFNLTSMLHKLFPNIPIIPDKPYYDGRFTDGLVWDEYVAKALHLDTSQLKHYLNYAYGGAWATKNSDGGQDFPPPFTAQVDRYLLAHGWDNKDQSLYLVLVGNNDFLTPVDDIEAVASNMGRRIDAELDKLVKNGARHFIVALLPDLSLTPRAKEKNLRTYYASASLAANKVIMIMLDRFMLKHPDKDIDILRYDTALALNDIVSHAESYGFSVVDKSCLDDGPAFPEEIVISQQILASVWPKVGKPVSLHNNVGLNTVLRRADDTNKICSNPKEHIFWDDVHPTSATHKVFAKKLCEKINNSTGHHFWQAKAHSYISADCSLI